MQMKYVTQIIVEELNTFWGRLFTYNHALMKRSEDEELFGTESFTDIIDFYLTSQALTFVKDVLLQHFGSPGMLLTARCFLEGLALKRLYQKGEISDLQIELLRKQVHLIEYNYYKNFHDIADIILIPEKLSKDKDDVVVFFREKLSDNYTDEDITNILKSNLPFLCQGHVVHRKMVAETLGEDYAKLYGLYSQAIHPSVNDFYSNEGIWSTIPDILLLITQEYSTLPLTRLTFEVYYTAIYTAVLSRKYNDLVAQECNLLNQISNEFQKTFEKNYTSDTLTSLSLILSEICSDKLLGLSEQVKSKWKIILDMLASFQKCYLSAFPREERFKLLEEHERMQIKRNIGEEYPLDKAYNYYKSLYPNGIEQSIFEKNFRTTTGYSIDDKGFTESLTRIVKDFVSKFPVKNPKSSTSWDRVMLLDYVESQMISHANGYLWYANSGSWGDIVNIIMATDHCLVFILKEILLLFETHRIIDKSSKYKSIITAIKTGINTIKKLSAEKATILKTHGIKI